MKVIVNDKCKSSWTGETGLVIRTRGTTDDFLNTLVRFPDRPNGVWFSKKELDRHA